MGIELTRRHFAGLCAALGTVPLIDVAVARGAPSYLSAYRDQAGRFGVAAIDDEGTILFSERLPARGHDTVVSPDGQTAVTFARRPGRFALAFSLDRVQPPHAFEAAQGRHFYGHGFFTGDGRFLLATENDYSQERGVLGLYEVQARYRRIGELDTHGLGPHEALLLHDGQTAAIANGGILTHPDHPRQKLNLPTMAPSLAYVDIETGDLIERVTLPPELHQLSIRHLTQTSDGAVWFGGQFEGAPGDPAPLIGRHVLGGDIEMVHLPEQHQLNLRNYVGSIKTSYHGEHVAVTSPRGGIALIIDARSHRVLRALEAEDIGGVAGSKQDFVFTSGTGRLSLDPSRPTTRQWDNHLRRITGS